MTALRFTKLHGAGNDFILVDARAQDRDWPGLARRLCQRHFGVGADGLILVLPSAWGDFRMRIFNADGSEAEMCGNGIRCFTRYLLIHDITHKRSLQIETLAGMRQVQVLGEDRAVTTVRVAMGAPEFAPARIPVAVESPGPVLDLPLPGLPANVTATCLSMGNPHAVYFLPGDPAAFPLEKLGPLVEHHPLFPRRTNFEIARLTAPGELQARVWERGVGETLACGTGACAVGVAAHVRGLARGPVRVALPGGVLEVAWDGAGEVFLTGPAVTVFDGEIQV